MRGKTHAAIGFIIGASVTAYGIVQGDFSLALVLVSAPPAAMLPDADHAKSKAGKLRKRLISMSTFALGIISTATLLFLRGYLFESLFAIPMLILITFFLSVAVYFLRQSKPVKKIFKFSMKHRGLSHTLVIPLLVAIIAIIINDRYAELILYGFIVGYMSHIIADCFTPRGCPILFPFSDKSICFLKSKKVHNK